jgi:hypothetical protein
MWFFFRSWGVTIGSKRVTSTLAYDWYPEASGRQTTFNYALLTSCHFPLESYFSPWLHFLIYVGETPWLGIMAILRPLMKPKIVKKRTKNFKWHQSAQYVTIKHNWWKPRGTDSRVWRRLKAQIILFLFWFCDAGDWSLSTTHARQALYHWAIPPTQRPRSLVMGATGKQSTCCSVLFHICPIGNPGFLRIYSFTPVILA